MAFYFQKSYRPEIEQLLRQYYQSLSEKDRRRFAALEAIQLGHGGIRYMSKVLGCDPQTIKDRTAGDPMREDVVWTDLTPQEIADRLQAQGVCAGPRIVRRILDTLGLARRQMAKVLSGGDSPHRDAQFRHLVHLMQEFLEAGNPVLSIDTKKKECLGTLYRDGKVYCQQALKAFDHDFPSLATGVIIPHGIYDLARNQGWIHV